MLALLLWFYKLHIRAFYLVEAQWLSYFEYLCTHIIQIFNCFFFYLFFLINHMFYSFLFGELVWILALEFIRISTYDLNTFLVCCIVMNHRPVLGAGFSILSSWFHTLVLWPQIRFQNGIQESENLSLFGKNAYITFEAKQRVDIIQHRIKAFSTIPYKRYLKIQDLLSIFKRIVLPDAIKVPVASITAQEIPVAAPDVNRFWCFLMVGWWTLASLDLFLKNARHRFLNFCHLLRLSSLWKKGLKIGLVHHILPIR